MGSTIAVGIGATEGLKLNCACIRRNESQVLIDPHCKVCNGTGQKKAGRLVHRITSDFNGRVQFKDGRVQIVYVDGGTTTLTIPEARQWAAALLEAANNGRATEL